MAGITLSELLKKMIEMGGSDLHITTNSAPRVRVHGRLRPLDMPPLTAADTKSLAYSVLTDAQKHRFEENLGPLPRQRLQSARCRRRSFQDHSLGDQGI
jgi:twitching motility protein PilT